MMQFHSKAITFATVNTSAPILTIATNSLANGTQGQPLAAQQLAATGGTPPYVLWQQIGGFLNPLGGQLQGPTPTPAVNMNFTGNQVGISLPDAEVDSVTYQVTDSVGATASKVFTLTTNAAAYVFTMKYLTGSDNAFQSAVPPTNNNLGAADLSHYVNIDAWEGTFTHVLNGWSSRIWIAGVAIAFPNGGNSGFPFVSRGWYPNLANPCATINGGSSSAPGVNSCIQISALTKAKKRLVYGMPNQRTQNDYNVLCDDYLYSSATPNPSGPSNGASYPTAQTALALSVLPGFLDTAAFWQNMIGIKNLTAASLAVSDYANTAGAINMVMADSRMWFYKASNETWAAIQGPIATTHINAPGSGYTAGTYTAVPLVAIGGVCTGALATIVVAGGIVTTVTVTTPGTSTCGATFGVAAANVGGSGSGFIGQVVTNSGGGTAINNTLRLFAGPWTDTCHVGSKYLYVDYVQLLKDLLANSTITALFPQLHAGLFLGNLALGLETDGSTLYTISAINTATGVVTTSSTATTNPFSVNMPVGFNGVGGTTQLNTLTGVVTAIGGVSGAWTATTNINMSGFGAFTSGGVIHNVIFNVLDFQTAMQGEADPIIPTTCELGPCVSRNLPTDASTSFGGAFVAVNGTSGNCNLWYLSNVGTLSAGNPAYIAQSVSSLSQAQKKNILLHWWGGGSGQGYFSTTPQNLPGNYTIDVNTTDFSAGVAPASGWITLATVTLNTQKNKVHVLGDLSSTGLNGDIKCYRLRCTAQSPFDSLNQGLGLHIGLHNCPQTTGSPDGTIWFADSIGKKSNGPEWGEEGGVGDSIGNQIYNYTGHIPICVNAGISGWALSPNTGAGYPPFLPFFLGTNGAPLVFAASLTTSSTNPALLTPWGGTTDQYAVQLSTGQVLIIQLTNGSTATGFVTFYGSTFASAPSAAASATAKFVNWMQDFPCRYVVFELGTNDPAASVSLATFGTNLTRAINIALALGKTVIVPACMYSDGDAGVQSTTTSATITSVLATFAGNPRVITGWNRNTVMGAFASVVFNASDTIHPSPYGQVIDRGFEGDWQARCMYLGQNPSTWQPDFSVGTGIGGH